MGHHDHDHHGHNDHNEVITTVQLTFTPASGGEPLIASWSDPESDGSPVIEKSPDQWRDPAVTMAFLNELEDPAEDMTAEIQQESDEHQALLVQVQGPAHQTIRLRSSFTSTDEDSAVSCGFGEHVHGKGSGQRFDECQPAPHASGEWYRCEDRQPRRHAQ